MMLDPLAGTPFWLVNNNKTGVVPSLSVQPKTKKLFNLTDCPHTRTVLLISVPFPILGVARLAALTGILAYASVHASSLALHLTFSLSLRLHHAPPRYPLARLALVTLLFTK